MGGGVFSWTLAILLDIAFFMVLYIMLLHGTSTWREILFGATGAGLLWELAKKAFFILYHQLCHCLEPGLWLSGCYYRHPDLGLPEQTDLSLWRLLKRFIFPAQTEEKRIGW
jgi:hypothetical protein